MPDITDTIEQIAEDGVQAATVDGQSTTAVPIPDLIAADKYLKAQEAAAGANPNGGVKSPWNRLRPARLISPGWGDC